ncbi:putative ribonuclease H protein [Sesbania bispinosa]|nr:putative ribonuclease H protein [Sesbania bispinosa]
MVFGIVPTRDALRFIPFLWWQWRWHNQFVFDPSPWSIEVVLQQLYISLAEFSMFAEFHRLFNHPDSTSRWMPPEVSWSKINVGGSFLPQSNSMGAGGLVRDSSGNWISGFSSFDGDGDVLLSELIGIGRDLEIAVELVADQRRQEHNLYL